MKHQENIEVKSTGKPKYVQEMIDKKDWSGLKDLGFEKLAEKEKMVLESGENKQKAYTVREGKIIEIERGTTTSKEKEFSSHIETIKYQVAAGNTHNFSKEDNKIMQDEVEKIAHKKGYSVVKEHDKSYTLISHSQEEIKTISEPYIFKELKEIDNLNTIERRLGRLENMGELNKIDNLRHSLNGELDRVYQDIASSSQEREFFQDPQKGDNQERAKYASEELHNKESEFQALMKIAKKYDIETDRVHDDLSERIGSNHHDVKTFSKTQETSKSHNSTQKKIDFGKIAKQFRRESPQKNVSHKNRGIER